MKAAVVVVALVDLPNDSSSAAFQGLPKHNHNHNFPKKFASDATPKRHLMTHQMKNLCGFSVFHCVEGAFGASSGGTPKMKNGAPRDELKNGCGRVGPPLYPAGFQDRTGSLSSLLEFSSNRCSNSMGA